MGIGTKHVRNAPQSKPNAKCTWFRAMCNENKHNGCWGRAMLWHLIMIDQTIDGHYGYYNMDIIVVVCSTGRYNIWSCTNCTRKCNESNDLCVHTVRSWWPVQENICQVSTAGGATRFIYFHIECLHVDRIEWKFWKTINNDRNLTHFNYYPQEISTAQCLLTIDR